MALQHVSGVAAIGEPATAVDAQEQLHHGDESLRLKLCAESALRDWTYAYDVLRPDWCQ